MSSEDIVNYLIDIGSNERKLQYCLQILAQNSFFTPQAAFNINSSQNKTTLFKSQLLELFKSTGLTSTEQNLELIFQYFQIDGKNFVTLEQFSTILLPQPQIVQRNNKKSEKYQLKYSLQKFFLQILENQTLLERHSKLKKKEEQGISKKIFKLTLDHLKSFLSFHGKYPSQYTLQQILKELLLNKGTGNRSKFVAQYIVQFNESAKKSIPTSKMETEKPLQRNNIIQVSKIDTQIIKMEQKTQKLVINKPALNFIAPGNQKTTQMSIKLNANAPKAENNGISSVQDRIKSLMSSVNMKAPTKTQITRLTHIKQTNSNKIQEFQIDTNKRPLQTERQFGEIKLRQNFESRQKVCKKTSIQDNDFSYKMKKFKKSKVLSQENCDNISFDQQSRHIFCTNAESRLTVQSIKQNQVPTKQKSDKETKSQKSKRISYLKSLVGENSAGKSKNVQTYRI